MTVNQVIRLARKHIGSGTMVSSAELCLADAIKLEEQGKGQEAKARALKSIAYSVGKLHVDYIEASK